MKKLLHAVCLGTLLSLFLLTATALAAEAPGAGKVSVLDQMRAGSAASTSSMRGRTPVLGRGQQTSAQANLPAVAILYLNNAKTTYDGKIDQTILGALGQALPETKYKLVDGAPYMEKLNKLGIADLTTAERSDIVEVFKGEKVDYCLFLEVQPFVMHDKFTVFTIGKYATVTMPLKVIDLMNNRYLYNGKFTEKASDSTVVGDIGNKSVALKALNKIDQQMQSVLQSHLPTTKAVKEAPAK